MRADCLAFKELKDFRITAKVEIIIEAMTLEEAMEKAKEYLCKHCESNEIIGIQKEQPHD